MHDDIVEITLTDGSIAVVDRADYRVVAGHTWTAVKRGRCVHACTRVRVSDAGRRGGWKTVYMHRMIMGNPLGQTVDHRDHDGLNNRRKNLRLGSQRQNTFNQRANETGRKKSRFKGVTRSDWNKNPKWVATIAPAGRRINLGSFDVEEDAARAYDRAAVQHFGEYATLNFGA